MSERLRVSWADTCLGVRHTMGEEVFLGTVSSFPVPDLSSDILVLGLGPKDGPEGKGRERRSDGGKT